MMRLGLAGTVAVVHAFDLSANWQPTFGPAGGTTDLGSIAVDAFFVLSGFLVTRSFLRLDSLPRYLWHRFLRIMPAFWVCLLLTALVLAPLLAVIAGRPVGSVFTAPASSSDYLLNNGLLLMRQYGIDGLPVTGDSPGVLDGSLWTLFYEALCYALIAGFGILGLLRRAPVAVLAAAGLSWALLIASAAGVEVGSSYLIPLSTVFLFGAAGQLFADRLPVHDLLAAGCGVVWLAGLFGGPVTHALTAPLFAYLCLWAMVRLPIRANPGWDISYGVYIYHWPVLQLLIALGATAVGQVTFVVLGLACTALAAAASWWLVEEPALRLKNWSPQNRAAWVAS